MEDDNIKETLFKIKRDSRYFSSVSPDLINYIEKNKIEYFHHTYGISPKHFHNYEKLNSFYSVTSESNTHNGTTLVSSIEGKNVPFYASQFHPEKSGYIWLDSINADHSYKAILFEQQISNFFVQEARKNFHSFSSENEKNSYLIYNYESVKVNHLFMKCYFFKNPSKKNYTLIE